MSFLPGFRFWRRFEVLPWVQVNVSKTGLSVSLGPDDAHITTGKNGTYVFFDVPGRNTYYRRKVSALMDDIEGEDDEQVEQSKSTRELTDDELAQREKLEVSFLDRLTTSGYELDVIDSLRAMSKDDWEKAYERASRAADSEADAAFLAGILAFRHGHFESAEQHFQRALQQSAELNQVFSKHEINMSTAIPITEEILVQVTPSREGTLVALGETYQHLDQPENAIEVLRQRYNANPEDLLVRLSLAELLSVEYPDNNGILKEVLELAEGVHNESPVHAALMLYRGRALRKLGLLDGARDTLTRALRRRKGYPSDLRTALRYERALVYEADGRASRAEEEFEKIFANDPTYEDVAERLGL